MQLVIDTAGPACSVALLSSDGIIDQRHERIGRGHAERLMPLIAEMLGERRPEAILVDAGPGSFTGLRVGLAAARALALGWGLPLAGYRATQMIAACALRDHPDAPGVTVAMMAGHGQMFVESFDRIGLDSCGALASLPPAEACRHAAHGLIAGSAAALLVETAGGGRACDPDWRAADALLLPVAARALPPVAIYGRPPDARPAGVRVPAH